MAEHQREFRIQQDGMVVAGASGPAWRAVEEIMRYAKQYAEDGPIVIEERVNGKWRET